MAGTTLIIIKTEEAVKQYNIGKGKGRQTHLTDREVELKNLPNPADAVKVIEAKEYRVTQKSGNFWKTQQKLKKSKKKKLLTEIEPLQLAF